MRTLLPALLLLLALRRMTGAAVASANPADCAGQPDTFAGLGRCLVAMARKYAPSAKIALHGSPWATSFDCATNADPHLDVAAQARITADFLASCAPAAGCWSLVRATREEISRAPSNRYWATN